MNTVLINQIVISNRFKKTRPKEKKLNEIREHVEKYGTLDKPIVLQGDLLVDGYARFIIAKEYEMKRVPCIQTSELNEINENKPFAYIVGRFETSGKEYVWKVPHKITVEVGDTVLVDSKFCKKNRGVVTVVRVFHSDDKDMLRHKSVIKKLKNDKKIGENM